MKDVSLLPLQEGVFFDEKEHSYFYKGIEVPSSSRIISLVKDFDKNRWLQSLRRKGVPEADAIFYMEGARDLRASIGTELHRRVHSSLLGTSLPSSFYGDPEEVDLMFAEWEKHVEPRIGKVFLVEAPGVHLGGCYGFTPDLVAEIDGVISLADWKTSQVKTVDDRHIFMQQASSSPRFVEISRFLQRLDLEAGKRSADWHRVRPGWQVQQGAYAFGLSSRRLRVERAINFIVSADGVSERQWNWPDICQGWLQFASGLRLHHARMARADPASIFSFALQALEPLTQAAEW